MAAHQPTPSRETLGRLLFVEAPTTLPWFVWVKLDSETAQFVYFASRTEAEHYAQGQKAAGHEVLMFVNSETADPADIKDLA